MFLSSLPISFSMFWLFARTISLPWSYSNILNSSVIYIFRCGIWHVYYCYLAFSLSIPIFKQSPWKLLQDFPQLIHSSPFFVTIILSTFWELLHFYPNHFFRLSSEFSIALSPCKMSWQESDAPPNIFHHPSIHCHIFCCNGSKMILLIYSHLQFLSFEFVISRSEVGIKMHFIHFCYHRILLYTV